MSATILRLLKKTLLEYVYFSHNQHLIYSASLTLSHHGKNWTWKKLLLLKMNLLVLDTALTHLTRAGMAVRYTFRANFTRTKSLVLLRLCLSDARLPLHAVSPEGLDPKASSGSKSQPEYSIPIVVSHCFSGKPSFSGVVFLEHFMLKRRLCSCTVLLSPLMEFASVPPNLMACLSGS